MANAICCRQLLPGLSLSHAFKSEQILGSRLLCFSQLPFTPREMRGRLKHRGHGDHRGQESRLRCQCASVFTAATSSRQTNVLWGVALGGQHCAASGNARTSNHVVNRSTRRRLWAMVAHPLVLGYDRRSPTEIACKAVWHRTRTRTTHPSHRSAIHCHRLRLDCSENLLVDSS